MASSDKLTPLVASNNYYGKNDNRPLSCGKMLCVIIGCIILSPLILLFIILICFLLCCKKFTPGQQGMMKVKTLDFWWFKAPGKSLEIKSTGADTSDIIISSDFVSEGKLLTCGGAGFSLRKSIECSVDAHIRAGPLGAKIEGDTNVEKPRYHLHGTVYPYDPNYGEENQREMWTNSARYCHWPACYTFTGLLPEGMGCSGLTEKITLESAPAVFGYILLFELTNPTFFIGDSRNIRVGISAVDCPKITPENEGKLFVRYGYKDAYGFGNLPSNEPDAYIFKGKTLKDAQMKLLHTYRLMKPSV
jgi:hypothetical protein